MIKIALTNQKGGVAKTTTAFSIAAALDAKGYKVLCVDADPQENLAIAAGIDLNKVDPEIMDMDYMMGLAKIVADVDLAVTPIEDLDVSSYTEEQQYPLMKIKEELPRIREKEEENYERAKRGLFPGEYATLDLILRGKARVEDAIIPVDGKEHMSIIVAGTDLTDADVYLASNLNQLSVLRERFASIEDNYDFCIIDCSPAIGRLLGNVLFYADYAIIPVEPALYATFGLYKLYQLIFGVYELRESYKDDTNIKVLGWLLTKVKSNTSNSKVWIEEIEDRARYHGARVFETKISQRVAIEESQTARMDIFEYSRMSGVSKDSAKEYQALVEEILAILGKDGIRMIAEK